ncbi:MAG: hypothetical protein H0T56_08305 [Pseudaminobacter sp.]|nr:hypothetical protein [Pseudaminobacter sp.]
MQVNTYPRFAEFFQVEFFEKEKLSDQQRFVGRFLGFVLAALLSLYSFNLGAQTYLANVNGANFYMQNFSPALALACTGELRRTRPTEVSSSFLSGLPASSNICDQISGQKTIPFSTFDRGIYALYAFAALCWSILGISWANLYPIAGFFTAGYALSSYFLVHAFTTSRLLAAALAVAVVAAAPAVDQIPNLRDYSKAPFIAAALAALTIGALRATTQGRQSILFLIAGGIVALGLGFRSDIQIMWPIALMAALMLIRNDRPLGRNFAVFGSAIGAFAAGYMLLRLPHWIIFGGLGQSTTNTGHVFLLGFAENYFYNLGMDRPLYSIFAYYKDEYAAALIKMFRGAGNIVQVYGPEYQKTAIALLQRVVALFPNDILMRSVFSIINTAKFPLMELVIGLPLLVMLPIAYAYKPKSTFFLSVSVAISVAVLSLQFHPRHAFFVSIFGAAFLALVGSAFAQALRLAVVEDLPWKLIGSRLRWLAGIVAVAAAAAGITTAIASVWQNKSLQELAKKYETLTWEPTHFQTDGDDIRLGDPSRFGAGGMGRIEIRRDLAWQELPRLDVPLNWKTRPGNVLQQSPDLVRAETKESGYAAWVPGFSLQEVDPTIGADGATSARILVSFEYSTDAIFDFFVLTGKAEMRFRKRLEIGDGRLVEVVEIPLSADRPRFVFSQASEGAAFISFKAFAIRDITKHCPALATAISPTYRFRNESSWLIPMKIPEGATRLTYYFPVLLDKAVALDHLAVKGIPPVCINWSMATHDLAGVPLIELLLEDGNVADTRRGSWSDAWNRFIELSR